MTELTAIIKERKQRREDFEAGLRGLVLNRTGSPQIKKRDPKEINKLINATVANIRGDNGQ